jgi:hypothetical protein
MSKKQKQPKKNKDAMPFTARSWDNNAHRLAALGDFLDKIKAPGEKQKCCSSSKYAKKKFAEWGRFYVEGAPPSPGLPPVPPDGIEPIPKNTKFRVHRHGLSNRLRRDKRVVIVLPRESGDELEKLVDVALWRCSYTPYDTKYRKRSERQIQSRRA